MHNVDVYDNNFDKIMSKRRFEQLRSALCFNAFVSAEDMATDPLIRIRPLIRCFNTNACRYIIVGRNLSVDEASIACRSKYGRGLIVYNPTKPGEKYHFQPYVLASADCYVVLSTIVHSRCSLEDDLRANGEEEDLESVEDFILEVEECSALRKLMLVLSRSFHGSNRILNS